MENLLENKLLCEEWVNTFLEKPSLGDLDRDMLLQYVEKINVFEGKKIEIVYRFQDELVTAARLAEQIGKETDKEVRITVPGHTQRGGTPCSYDRVFCNKSRSEGSEN